MWGSGENEAHPRQIVNADDEARLRGVGKALLAEHSKLDTADPAFEPWSSRVSPDMGIPFPDLEAPIRIQVTKLFAPLTDFVATFAGSAINKRVRDAIEVIEPGVHRYLPVEFTMPDGSPADSYWILNIATRINSVAIDQSTGIEDVELYPNHLPGYREFRGDLLRSRTILTLRSDVIRGRAIWWEAKLRRTIISNSFNEFIVENKVRGFERNTLLINEVLEV